MENELRQMFEKKGAEMNVPHTLSPELRNGVGRQRMVLGGLVAAAALALAVGGFAVRSAVSTDAAPVRPADDPIEPRQDVEVLTGSLAAVDPATGRSRALVDGAEIQGEIANAAWSPAGKWVAYDIHARKGGLWVVSPQGEHRQLAEEAGAWAWSPTDARLAMMRNSTLLPDTVEGPFPLTLLDASTGRENDLGRTIGDATTGPVWSPDGTRIVYGVREGSIYSVNVEGGDHTLLVRLPGNLDSIYALEWSPDGAHMAILAAPFEGGLQRLYVMNADGSGLRLLVDDFEPGGWGLGWFSGDPFTQLAWSPDGTRLTYSAFTGPDQRELQIWTASLDGSAPSLVASHTNDECCVDGGDPVWSPDGSHIAFETDKANETVNAGHLVVNADGTGGPREIDRLTYLSWRGGWYFCRCYG